MLTILPLPTFSFPERVSDVCEMVTTINEFTTSAVIVTFNDSNILCEF